MIADLQNIKYVYFVGIGGIGMSALARWFNANGREVVGYDRSQTVLTKELESENIAIHYDTKNSDDKNNSAAIHGNVDLIPEHFRTNKAQVLVIYTPAVSKNHSELLYFQQHGFIIKKRAEVLGLISQNMRCIAVAGTHGKTTTSSMIAHILTYSGVDCAAFLGGITQNYKTNLLLNKTQSKDTFVVVEADEYDRSFLQLFPEIAVITSTDADHLDIYGSEAEVQNSYATFATQVTTTLFANLHANIYPSQQENNHHKNSGNITELQADLNLYALNPFATKSSMKTGGIFATNIHIKNARFVFNYVSNQVSINEITLIIPGFHNVENAVAAISVALAIGIDAAKIKDALANFRGVKRRFEYIFESENHVQIDDYAHHPTEIRAFLESVRALYPNRHITAVFQPHLFSRTKDFYQDFAQSLSLANRLVLLPIYPARELQADFPTINSQIILDLVTIQDKQIIDYQNVTTFLQTQKNDIICTIGAGDVEGLIIPIKTSLDINYKIN